MLKTKDGRTIDVQVLSYNELMNKIRKVDPEFASLLKQLPDDNSNIKFYQASYKFGDKIISNEQCYLPLTDGGSINFNDPQLPDELKTDLAYNPEFEDPLGIIISKSSEFYVPLHNRVLPSAIIKPGSMFGVPRAIDLPSATGISTSSLIRSLNAGARSLFMLHKISDNIRHSKLQRKYGIDSQAPQAMQEHWQIFAEIARSVKSSWRSEIIYFPRSFIDKLKTMNYATATVYIMHKHRSSYNVWHNLAQMWNVTFGEIEQEKDLSNIYQPYSLATTRQLFMVAANSAPAFKPSTDEEMAPIKEIQDAYINGYYIADKENRKYSLIIMEATNFGSSEKTPVYYSPNYSTFEQVKSENSQSKSNITILQEIIRANEVYRQGILNSKKPITSLYNVVTTTEFSYFHSNPTDYKNIASSSVIPELDSRFTPEQIGEFPKDSPFFKGCIRISHKD